jgi:hypothetical protein
MNDALEELEIATSLLAEALAADDFTRLEQAVVRREAAVRVIVSAPETMPHDLERMRRVLHAGTESVRRLLLMRQNLSLELARAGGERRMLETLNGVLGGGSRKSLDCRA